MTTRTPPATPDLSHASVTIVVLRAAILVIVLLLAGTMLGTFLGYVVVAGLHVAGVDDLDLAGLDWLPLAG